jgi:MYXO-CTERM domain-containing protein
MTEAAPSLSEVLTGKRPFHAEPDSLRGGQGVWSATIAHLRLDGRFDADGARFVDSGGGALSLRTTGWGREGGLRPFAATPAAEGCQPDGTDCGTRLLSSADGVTEWWEARDAGFEQGWELAAPPAGDGPLVFAVTVTGAEVYPWISGLGADLVARDGSAWSYSGVEARDADGLVLPAVIEGEGDALRVVVDDAGAAWPITVDPVLTTASATINGTSSAYLGASLDGGDVDGDGYSDLVVGGYRYSSRGVVYIYRGTASGIGATPTTTLYGATSNNDRYFGWVVKTGDFNNDGYDDVAVSELTYANGTVYIFMGSASGVSTTAARTFAGTTTNEYMGQSLAVGDFNNDGYDDIAAGAMYRATYGAIDIHYGSSSGLSTTSSLSLTGASGERIGYAADGVGDVNHDGYDDFVTCSYEAASYYGRARVYTGGATGISATRVTVIDGPVYDTFYGRECAGLGDINGDGYDDMGVGAPGFDIPYDGSGAMYVYNGSSSGLSTTATTTLYGLSYSDYFGWSIDSAGDTNGDGYGDVIVGSPYGSGSSSATGQARVIPGSATGLDVSGEDEIYEGTTAYEMYGAKVAGVGDINGDGFDDVAVGRPEHTGGSTRSGVAYLYLGTDGSTIDADGDGYYTSTDCDDTSASVHPGATETCNSVDDDCDDVVDDGVSTTYYRDADSDGYGSTTVTTTGCSVPSGYVTTATDCNDSSALAHPGGTEVIADSIDEDCINGEICYADADHDAYGTSTTVVSADSDCADTGEATTTTDCNDTASTVHPLATEVRGDGIDQDCDSGDTCYSDADHDGYGGTSAVASTDLDCTDSGEATTGTDCNDATSAISPGATEFAADGIDQDCSTGDTCYVDSDHDSYGTTATVVSADLDCADSGEAAVSTDCSDSASSIHPGATETRGDGIDQDCDSGDTCYADADRDGYGGSSALASTDLDCADAGEATSATDCDDTSASISPAGTEIPADGIDQDCSTGDTCYVDSDHDSYGSALTVVSADLDCLDTGEAAVSSDCNDTTGVVHPGGTEVRGDGVDQDCDGGDTCYADADRDGYGVASGSVVSADLDCADAGESASASDCDDTSAVISPAASEIPADGIDQDCSTGDSCYVDADGDSYGSSITVVSADLDCLDSGEAAVSSDCNDRAVTIHPGGVEVKANGIDEDCDNGDTCYADTDFDAYGSTTAYASVDLDCADVGESSVNTDCDDTANAVHPAAPETPIDGIDQDCDGGDSCYTDADHDSYGSTVPLASADTDCVDVGEATSSTDCDDSSARIYPGASEAVADGIDQSCDGGDRCFADTDGDGHGSPTVIDGTTLGCDGPGESTSFDDCDDTSATIYTGAVEVAGDGVDQDCDGGDTCYVNADGDTQGIDTLVLSADADCTDAGEAAVATDCDDTDADVYAGAPEAVGDGVDADCDGEELCYVDSDGDAFGSAETTASASLVCEGEGLATLGGDCDDTDADVSPAAEEAVADGVDGDCNGVEICYTDADVDGHGVPGTTYSSDVTCSVGGLSLLADDCDDTDDTIYPTAPEVPADAVDQDCDGGDACYADTDGDGYGSSESVASANMSCAEAGEATTNSDCDDAAVSSFPGASETCNGDDDNCDGNVDEGLADCETDIIDADGGCGCSTPGPAPVTLAPLAGLLLLAVRRRRA